MGKEKNFGQMGLIMKENTLLARELVKELFNILMGRSM
jgi:hypothetical protein